MSPMSDDVADDELSRLHGEVLRLRALLESERAACLSDMMAGAVELEEGDERLARQREIAGVLRDRVRRLREHAHRQEARIVELEAELARGRNGAASQSGRLRSLCLWGRR